MSKFFSNLRRARSLSRKALLLLLNDPLAFVRAVYVRLPVLVIVRVTQVRAQKWATETVHNFLGGSPGNAPALAELEENRTRLAASASLAGEIGCIDISIVTYNSERWIRRFMQSLLAQQFLADKMHVVFVDHGSEDGTLATLYSMRVEVGWRFASFTIIQQANKGFGAGHDRAIRATTSDWILVTNVDIEFKEDSIVRAIEFASNDIECVAAWELRQMPFEHPKHYDPVTLETNWQSHACILLRRQAYLQVGGYEPKIFMYGEDVELSYRFRSHGFILRYIPVAAVMHYSYADEGQLLKPLQYTGATLGNALIRLRYGQAWDRIVGLILLAGLIFRRQPFPRVRKVLVHNFAFALAHSVYFMRGRGPIDAHFPFRGFDFELRRSGAECKAEPMPQEVRVTIITRTYDAPGRTVLLESCGRSIANQTYRNIEWLVVQDGPGEEACEVVKRIAAQVPWLNARFIECERKGRSHTGNVGLASATGTLCMFLDDDDLLYGDHVDALYSALRNSPEASAAYSLSFEVQCSICDGKRTSYSYSTPSTFFQTWDFDTLLKHNFIPIQSILFKRDLYVTRGGFNTDLEQLEDWNLWLRYGFGNVFVYLPKTTSLFHTPYAQSEKCRRQFELHAAYMKAKSSAIFDIIQFSSDDRHFSPPAFNESFPWIVRALIDNEAYHARNPDVASAGIDPADHWLKWGYQEGRQIAEDIAIRVGADAERVNGRSWVKFTWKGMIIAICKLTRPSNAVCSQILAAAKHDGSVIAAGPLAIPNLRTFLGPDLLERDGIDAPGIYRTIRTHPSLIVLTPMLCPGGAEKFFSDIVREYTTKSHGSVLVLVTDQRQELAGSWQNLAIFNPLRDAQVVFWPNICGSNFKSPTVLARLLGTLKPNIILVNNSRVGLDAVSLFGLALSQTAQVFCTYFSYGLDGLGAPYGVRYPRKTLPHSKAITDNMPMSERLCSLWPGIAEGKILVLPPRIDIVDPLNFEDRLALRAIATAGKTKRKWLWVSRVERFKGISILGELAKVRSSDEFHIFGPMQDSLELLGLDRPNIVWRGILDDVLNADFRAFEAFVFTSFFEGMPNIVLEIAQHGIPMILADVGGLRDTFEESDVIFVNHAKSFEETAAKFGAGLDRLIAMSSAMKAEMARCAYRKVESRHGPSIFSENVSKILGFGADDV